MQPRGPSGRAAHGGAMSDERSEERTFDRCNRAAYRAAPRMAEP
jgi:hypothetical protein